MIIYLDMDGVVTDFNKFAKDTIKELPTNNTMDDKWKPTEWEKIRQIPNLFRNLPKTPFADTIVYIARKFRDELNWQLFMLTAIPKNNDTPDAFQDKIEWMQKHYPDIKVRFGPYAIDKQKHSKPGYILVDDRSDNCEQWKSNGGISIHVTKNYNLAIEQLKQEFINAKNYR